MKALTLNGRIVNPVSSNVGSAGLLERVLSKRILFYGFILIATFLLGIFAFSFFSSSRGNSLYKGPSISINKSFTITARTKDGKSTDKQLTLGLNKGQKTDQVLIQGKRAKVREGKMFLVVDLVIENKNPFLLYAFPVDLIRLISDDGKKYAPSVHQGTVETRPNSAKITNAGFIIDDNVSKFKLEVGEILGDKQIVEFKLN